MKAVTLTLSMLVASAAIFAQAPSPVQTNVEAQGDSHVPIFKVEVISRTIRAINYHHRQGQTKIAFRGTALMPDARGEADVTPNDGATRISLKFDHLSNPVQYGPEYLTLVLWGITPEGRPERLGEVTLRDAQQKTAELYATTDLASFGMIVTAEPYFNVSQPSDVVVMENIVREDTTGTMQDVDAKYELLKRGQYALNLTAPGVNAVTSDIKVPLQLREARLAMAIAKAQGAYTYAADTMRKADDDMTNAEGYYRSKDLKRLETQAREATQMAEDARRISIQKETEAATQAANEASARRVSNAQARASEAEMKAAEEARLRATAQAEAAAADAKKREAEAAMASAKNAQRDAEAAKAAAIAEQEKLAAAKASAESGREQAEKDAQALRGRLKDQLNLILMTRDTARGLIVNMSDVLFDTGQATLKPGAKEKLAKVSGILLAYPTLHLTVEGHTDSVGGDDYNQKLSEKRADSVREYLVSNGIATANIEAHGYGKDRPVATNDTAAGRQQNRRVEMVVNGDVIGQPLSDSAQTGQSGLNATH